MLTQFMKNRLKRATDSESTLQTGGSSLQYPNS